MDEVVGDRRKIATDINTGLIVLDNAIREGGVGVVRAETSTILNEDIIQGILTIAKLNTDPISRRR